MRAAMISLLSIACGCATLGPTTFTHPAYDFAFVERIAVVPLENLSQDRGAGARVSRHLVFELLATEAFDVVEPGEVSHSLESLGLVRTGELTRDQIQSVGRALGSQALVLGSVTESATVRSGQTTESIVAIDVRLVETETGETVWSTTHTESGRGFWSSLFGTGGKSLSEVTRKCVRKVVGELVQ